MRLILSDEPSVYGTVITTHGEIQVLLVEDSDDGGIHVERGGPSSFLFFVLVPVEVQAQLVEMHSESVFREALMRVCELLQPR